MIPDYILRYLAKTLEKVEAKGYQHGMREKGTKTQTKEFIRTSFASYKEGLAEKMAGLKRTDDTQMSDDRTYDEALADILALIKES